MMSRSRKILARVKKDINGRVDAPDCSKKARKHRSSYKNSCDVKAGTREVSP